MRKLSAALLAYSLLFFSPGLVSAVTVGDYPTGFVAGGIAMSRHNMGSLGRVIHTHNTSQICVFCHTPHHTNTAAQPIWNRSTTNSSSYTAYGTTSAGTIVNQTDLGSITLACLSCHDGVTTFDNLVNRPGKDLGTGDQGWQFWMPNDTALFTPSGPAPADHFGAPECVSCHGHSLGDFSGQVTRFVIGPSLSNDHPVSILYNETLSTAGLRPTGTVISSIDLVSGLSSSAATVYNSNLSQNRWAVNGAVSDSVTIEDLLVNGKVECSSCHDPHFRNLSWDEAESTWVDPAINVTNWCNNIPENCTDGNFLRRVGGNTGSAVCRTCHNK